MPIWISELTRGKGPERDGMILFRRAGDVYAATLSIDGEESWLENERLWEGLLPPEEGEEEEDIRAYAPPPRR